MELRQLRYVIAIAEQGNFARAAAGLNVTQSALTQSIARLERELDVRLFDRGRFGATPTEAAHLLMLRGRAMLSEERQVLRDIEALKGAGSGDIVIGVGKSMVNHIVPAAIVRFNRRHPDVVITAHEGWSSELFVRLLRGELDFVVSAAVSQLPVDPELAQEELFIQHEEVVIAADHPLADGRTVGLGDLADLHWIAPPFGNGRVRHLQQVFRDAGLPPPTRFTRTDSIGVLMALIRAKLGVGWATLELVGDYAQHGLQVLPLPELTEERRACLTFRRRSRMGRLAEQLAGEVRRGVLELRGEMGAVSAMQGGLDLAHDPAIKHSLRS